MAKADVYVRRERLVKAMVKDRALPPLALRAGIILATSFGHNNIEFAHWSYDGLAETLGATKSAVIRAVRSLDGRYFRVVSRSGGGRSWRNEYHPIEPGETVTEPTPIEPKERVTASSRNGDHLVTETVTAPSPERKELKEIRKGGADRAPVSPPCFEETMREYQAAKQANVGNVAEARQEYARIVSEGVSPVRLLQAVKSWRNDHDKQERPPFPVSLAKFLKEERWRVHEPDWTRYWKAIVHGVTGFERFGDLEVQRALERERQSWRSLMGADAPLPGEPGSPFPPELIPDTDREAA